ncbi:alpha/beta hydrolase family esterase [Chitinophaga sancti]|uniref:Alpha/beta hydrolase-fold protein n=2 Tax=Chitinophaga sancti TaxID=1004 RepID=A0ABZ0XC00_9BACT|nr:dienelactone hydrolase family protein [Chitinophaga sancti]WQD59736.1 alpha/beta hydrolase-fold protein [Chitinophaga sancti]WQG88133.1 alpha/beta hydrolase-fold protein [Chitinophaga sancti]
MRKMLISALLLLIAAIAVLFLYTYRWNIIHPNKSHSFHIDGYERSFIYHVPKHIHPNPKLVIVYHGSKLKSFMMQILTGHEFDLLADKNQDAIIVYPQGYMGNWNDGRKSSPFPAKQLNIDDVTFTKQLINYFEEQYHINTSQVYAVGFSNGGQMAFRLAASQPGLFAAYATIGSTLPAPENNLFAGHHQQAVSIILINGQQDGIVPYNGGEITLDGKSYGMAESAPVTAAYWRDAAGATEISTVQFGHTATQTNYYNKDNQKKVSFVTIKDGGHNIPNRNFRIYIPLLGYINKDVDAPLVIWDFFFKDPIYLSHGK